MYHILQRIYDLYIPTFQKLEQYRPWLVFENYFTQDECDKIIALGQSHVLKQGRIRNDELDRELRKSQVCYIKCTPESSWVFEKADQLLRLCNKKIYNFKLTGFYRSLQFTEYKEGGDHYVWHQDLGPGKQSTRKLSFTIQLSGPDDYIGGELEFPHMLSRAVSKSRGTVIVFPAYELHGVRPVVSGTRYSLVGWMHGPHFR